MIDVQGDVLWLPHCTTPAAVKLNRNKKLSFFKSKENIQAYLSKILGSLRYTVWHDTSVRQHWLRL